MPHLIVRTGEDAGRHCAAATNALGRIARVIARQTGESVTLAFADRATDPVVLVQHEVAMRRRHDHRPQAASDLNMVVGCAPMVDQATFWRSAARGRWRPCGPTRGCWTRRASSICGR